MAKIIREGALVDPFSLPRPEIITEERTFSEPDDPETKITVTFQSTGDFTLPMAIGSLAREFMRTHGAPNAIPIMVGGRKVEITEPLCTFIATIITLETERCPFEFWAATSATMPFSMMEIAVWAEDMLNREKRPEASTDANGNKSVPIPNGSAVVSESPAEPPQNTESTPNSSLAVTP